MATQSELILQRLSLIAKTELPLAKTGRNLVKPTSLPPAGFLNLMDGDPGEPVIDLSPLTYNYQHQIPVEVIGFPSGALSAGEVIELLTAPFARAIELDRSLGGLADYIHFSAAIVTNVEEDGTAAYPFGEFMIFANYHTRHPLG